MPPSSRSFRFVLRAAGFMTTRQLSRSPGVWMSVAAKWTWKPDTPARVPAGARISAGESGNVAMSLPARADVFVNWVPARCMPSPESPAKRIVIDETSSTRLGWPLVPGVMVPAEPFSEIIEPGLATKSVGECRDKWGSSAAYSLYRSYRCGGGNPYPLRSSFWAIRSNYLGGPRKSDRPDRGESGT